MRNESAVQARTGIHAEDLTEPQVATHTRGDSGVARAALERAVDRADGLRERTTHDADVRRAAARAGLRHPEPQARLPCHRRVACDAIRIRLERKPERRARRAVF